MGTRPSVKKTDEVYLDESLYKVEQHTSFEFANGDLEIQSETVNRYGPFGKLEKGKQKGMGGQYGQGRQEHSRGGFQSEDDFRKEDAS